MSGLSEDTIRQITERVTREVVAALSADTPVSVEDAWPDWNEYVDENGVMEEGAYVAALAGQFDPPAEVPNPHSASEDAPIGEVSPPQNSPLRARSRGTIPAPAARVAPDGTGPVLAIGDTGATGFRTASGFMPDPFSNPDWFARNFQKDVLHQRRQPAAEDGIAKAGQ